MTYLYATSKLSKYVLQQVTKPEAYINQEVGHPLSLAHSITSLVRFRLTGAGDSSDDVRFSTSSLRSIPNVSTGGVAILPPTEDMGIAE